MKNNRSIILYPKARRDHSATRIAIVLGSVLIVACLVILVGSQMSGPGSEMFGPGPEMSGPTSSKAPVATPVICEGRPYAPGYVCPTPEPTHDPKLPPHMVMCHGRLWPDNLPCPSAPAKSAEPATTSTP